jgi:hypothetical protein
VEEATGINLDTLPWAVAVIYILANLLGRVLDRRGDGVDKDREIALDKAVKAREAVIDKGISRVEAEVLAARRSVDTLTDMHNDPESKFSTVEVKQVLGRIERTLERVETYMKVRREE